MTTVTEQLKTFIRDVPDFPKPGIIFKDITPLLKSPEAFNDAVAIMAEPFAHQRIDKIAAIESRGFIFGAPIAQKMKCGFVPIRKPGKLPWTTYRNEYELEYGTDSLEIHCDAFEPGDRVLIIDDLLATGGTAAAAAGLVRMVGAEVAGFSMMVELSFLEGRKKLGDVPFFAALTY